MAYCPISSTDGLASNSESVATSRKTSKPYICSTGRIFSLYVRLMPSCQKTERSERWLRTRESRRARADGERPRDGGRVSLFLVSRGSSYRDQLVHARDRGRQGRRAVVHVDRGVQLRCRRLCLPASGSGAGGRRGRRVGRRGRLRGGADCEGGSRRHRVGVVHPCARSARCDPQALADTAAVGRLASTVCEILLVYCMFVWFSDMVFGVTSDAV